VREYFLLYIGLQLIYRDGNTLHKKSAAEWRGKSKAYPTDQNLNRSRGPSRVTQQLPSVQIIHRYRRQYCNEVIEMIEYPLACYVVYVEKSFYIDRSINQLLIVGQSCINYDSFKEASLLRIHIETRTCMSSALAQAGVIQLINVRTLGCD